METNDVISSVDPRVGAEIGSIHVSRLDNRIEPHEFEEMLRQAWLILNRTNDTSVGS